MSDADDGTISFVRLQAKRARAPVEETGFALREDHSAIGCPHLDIVVDESKAEVECRTCSTKLNPIWLLLRFTREESRLVQRRESLATERRAWEAKSSTKCRHCGRMTTLKPA